MSEHRPDPTYLAQEAKRLQEDPVLNQAFTNIEGATYDNLLGLEAGASDAERVYYITKLRVIRDIRAELESVIQNGKQAVRPAPAIA